MLLWHLKIIYVRKNTRLHLKMLTESERGRERAVSLHNWKTIDPSAISDPRKL